MTTYHPEASEELEEAREFYERRSQGLGSEFVAAVKDAMASVESFPEAKSPIGGGFRRCIVERFPYGIIFAPEPNRIFVIAIMHLHRRPGYWMKRI